MRRSTKASSVERVLRKRKDKLAFAVLERRIAELEKSMDRVRNIMRKFGKWGQILSTSEWKI